MAERKEYKIRIEQTLVPVTEDVYYTYHRMRRYVQTQKERDARNGLVSYNALDTEDHQGEELICDRNASAVEELVINNCLCERLRCCLSELDDDEKNLIKALYFEGISEREYAKEIGLSQKGVNKRRNRVLHKLRKNILKK